jgi:hypothetical protein
LGEKLQELFKGMPVMRLAILAALAVVTLSGCMAYEVASTAVGAATTVVRTTADVASDVVCTVACNSDDEKKK